MGDDTFSAELITTTATVNGDQRTKEKIHFVIVFLLIEGLFSKG